MSGSGRGVVAALAAAGALAMVAKGLRHVDHARPFVGPSARAIAEEVPADKVATAAQIAAEKQGGASD